MTDFLRAGLALFALHVLLGVGIMVMIMDGQGLPSSTIPTFAVLGGWALTPDLPLLAVLARGRGVGARVMALAALLLFVLLSGWTFVASFTADPRNYNLMAAVVLPVAQFLLLSVGAGAYWLGRFVLAWNRAGERREGTAS